MEMKQCSKCKEIKPLSSFTKHPQQKDGHHPSCKACRHEYYVVTNQRLKAKERYWQDPEKARKQTRQFRLAHPNYSKEASAKRYAEHKQECLQESANTRQRYRDDAFNTYGGYICVCCGETIPKFLTIDHINGITSQDRKAPRAGWVFYQWLRKQGYPFGYQVLCFNCNLGRARNQGICPHKG